MTWSKRLYYQTVVIFLIASLLVFPSQATQAKFFSPGTPGLATLWNTFLGGDYEDWITDSISDTNGNLYVCGIAHSSWRKLTNPIRPFTMGADVLVAKLDIEGNVLWHTFLGGTWHDECRSISLDSNKNILVAGMSDGGWGSPVNSLGVDRAVSVAKLDENGNLIWNTFLGAGGEDWGWGIAAGDSDNIYVVGHSNNNWGNPIVGYQGKECRKNKLPQCGEAKGMAR